MAKDNLPPIALLIKNVYAWIIPFSTGDKLVPSVQKKINELEVGLLHLQQNIDIPEISLPIHPTIQSVVKKANDAGRKPIAEELSGSLGDSTFLNALQKDVSRWIREIQKVREVDFLSSLPGIVAKMLSIVD